MTTLVEAGLSNVLASALLALLAIAVGLVCRRPAVAHALWLLVLVKLVTPPLFHVALPWPARPSAAAEAAAATPPVPPSREAEAPPEIAFLEEAAPAGPEGDEVGLVMVPDEPGEAAAAEDAAPQQPTPAALPPQAAGTGWQSLLGVVWLTGSAAWFLLAARRAWRFTRALQHSRPAPARVQERVEVLARQLGLARAPEVRLLPGRLPPMIWAVGRPVLLLPADLPGRVGAEGLDTLLVHELAHVRRRDHWVRWLEMLVVGLFWWDPLAWYARQQLREAEEQCCDAWVVGTLPQARRAYASALVDALDFLSPAEPPPQLASGVGQVADLKRRLTMIMRGTPSPRLGLISGLAVFALTGLMPLMPGWASAQEGGKKVIVIGGGGEGGGVLGARIAQGDAEKLEAELRKRLVEIDAIKQKIAEAKKAKVAKVTEKIAAHDGTTVRIEVSGLSTDEVKHLVAVLQKSMPEGKGKRVEVRIEAGKVGAAKGEHGFRFHIEGAKKGAHVIMVDPKTGKVTHAEGAPKVPGKVVAPKKPTPPLKAPIAFVPGTPKGPGDRMDRIEKQLEAVIKELSELRKQVGRPVPGGPGRGPGGPGGPGGRGPGAGGRGEGGRGGEGGGFGGGRGGPGGGGDRRPGPDAPVAPRGR